MKIPRRTSAMMMPTISASCCSVPRHPEARHDDHEDEQVVDRERVLGQPARVELRGELRVGDRPEDARRRPAPGPRRSRPRGSASFTEGSCGRRATMARSASSRTVSPTNVVISNQTGSSTESHLTGGRLRRRRQAAEAGDQWTGFVQCGRERPASTVSSRRSSAVGGDPVGAVPHRLFARLATVVTTRVTRMTARDSQVGISGISGDVLAAVDERQLVGVQRVDDAAWRR